MQLYVIDLTIINYFIYNIDVTQQMPLPIQINLKTEITLVNLSEGLPL